MAYSCVYQKYTSNSFKMFTVNRLLNPSMDLNEFFTKHVREAPTKFCSFSVFVFHIFLNVSDSLA